MAQDPLSTVELQKKNKLNEMFILRNLKNAIKR